MAGVFTKFNRDSARSAASLAAIVAGVWLLGGWLDFGVNSQFVPIGLAIAGIVMVSGMGHHQVITGLLIIVFGLFMGFRTAGIMELPWLRHIASFLLIGSGLWFFLASPTGETDVDPLTGMKR